MDNKIILGDCLIKLKELEDNSVDSIVTDPPYELGFMGKKWDNSGIAYNKELWKECLRVLKPGGHLLAFGGTRTYHRLAVAIEDAGFEVRDMIEWVYSTGFPKSLNIGKAVDKLQGNEREVVGSKKGQGSIPNDRGNWGLKPNEDVVVDKGTSEYEGWGTALKPAHEPICMARKPLAEKTVAENCLKWGSGGINIDESRVGNEQIKCGNAFVGNNEGRYNFNNGTKKEWKGNISNGRFPANLILGADENGVHEEVRECFPEVKGATSRTNGNAGNGFLAGENETFAGNVYKDNQTNASRFFKSIIYQAKASKSERNKGMDDLEDKPMYKGDGSGQSLEIFGSTDGGRENRKNNHPTVKPIALMEYLIKMVTPNGGVVLDPFAGSGTTLVASKMNGFKFIGIEMTEEYISIIEARLNAVKVNKSLFECLNATSSQEND